MEQPEDEKMPIKLDISGGNGFQAHLWLETSEVTFPGRDCSVREERIRAIAAHYAFQIADAIPGAQVCRAFPSWQPGLRMVMKGGEGVGTLHSVYLVEHPRGHIAVSAGYRQTDEGAVSDIVLVYVLSANLGTGGRLWVGRDRPRWLEAPKRQQRD